MSSITPESVVHVEAVATRAWSEGRIIYLELVDGRVFGFPADRFRILKAATDEELKQVDLELNGYALRWKTSTKILRFEESLQGTFNCRLNRRLNDNGFFVEPFFTSPAPW